MKKLLAYAKKNKDIVALFSIPAIIALIVVGVTLLPRVFANPGHSFVYYYCEYQCYDSSSYRVDNEGKIKEIPAKYNNFYLVDNSESRLFIYNPREGSSASLTLEEAKAYTLSSSSTSPDGYKIERTDNSSDGLFLLGGYSYNSDYAYKKSLLVKKIEIDNFSQNKFIGWVTDDN